jgi:hypothetical protein
MKSGEVVSNPKPETRVQGACAVCGALSGAPGARLALRCGSELFASDIFHDTSD